MALHSFTLSFCRKITLDRLSLVTLSVVGLAVSGLGTSMSYNLGCIGMNIENLDSFRNPKQRTLSANLLLTPRQKKAEEMRRYREKLRSDPVRYQHYLQKQNEYAKRRQERLNYIKDLVKDVK